MCVCGNIGRTMHMNLYKTVIKCNIHVHSLGGFNMVLYQMSGATRKERTGETNCAETGSFVLSPLNMIGVSFFQITMTQ